MTPSSQQDFPIFPAILSDSPDLVATQVQTARQSGVVEVVQVDIIDGFFADAWTIQPTGLADIDFIGLQIDVHLMTEEPLDAVYELQEMKQLPIRAILAQVEKMSSISAYIEVVEEIGWQVGLSLDLHTSLSTIEPNLWSKLDWLQLMGNRAGRQGQDLHPTLETTLKQACLARDKFGSAQPRLIVDIGVNQDTIGLLRSWGADAVVVGSALWQANDFNQAWRDLQTAANQA